MDMSESEEISQEYEEISSDEEMMRSDINDASSDNGSGDGTDSDDTENTENSIGGFSDEMESTEEELGLEHEKNPQVTSSVGGLEEMESTEEELGLEHETDSQVTSSVEGLEEMESTEEELGLEHQTDPQVTSSVEGLEEMESTEEVLGLEHETDTQVISSVEGLEEMESTEEELALEHETDPQVTSSVEGLEEIESTEEELELQHEINPQVDNIHNNGYVPDNPESPQISPRDSESSTNIPLEINDRASDLLMAISVGSNANKTKITEMAVSAMDELVRKALAGEPLWQRRQDSDPEILNEGEYIREFRAFDASLGELLRIIEKEEPQHFANLDENNGTRHKPTFRQDAGKHFLQTEASRYIGFVRMDSTSLVECLMDLKQWSSIFSNIVSRTSVLGVLSRGEAGSCNEKLQVMKAEFHMPTPLVYIRESQFARYCKQIRPGTWGVVDASLDSLFPYPLVRFRRRPSGCLIEEMPDGYSKVIWVEHVEVDNKFVDRIFWPIVLPGFAFSAMRWVASIVRHCEPVGDIIPTSLDSAKIPRNGKTILLRLAGRMMRSFYQDTSASTDNFWVRIPDLDRAGDFRLMTKTLYALNGSPSRTLVFTKSFWVPAPPKRVFDFLRCGDSRNQWDLLARGYAIQEIMHIIKGENPENRVSIMQVNSAPNRIEILYLQESYSNQTGSYVVYAPIDILSMATVLGGGNPDFVNILPSGFVIHPDGPLRNGEETRGSLLTLAFHIMDDSSTEESLPASSVYTVQKILTETTNLIKTALVSENL